MSCPKIRPFLKVRKLRPREGKPLSQVTELSFQPIGPCPPLMPGATWPSGPHLLRVEEYVSKALQTGHTDLRAAVLETLSQYRQGSLFRKHLQQGRAV